ncbi:MAG: hypothetical protein RSB24_03895 [Akkermansia sp.]
MPNNLIKFLIAAIFIIAISLYVGSASTEGATTTIVIIVGTIAIGILLSLQEKIWYLLIFFIFSPAIPFLPGTLALFVPWSLALLAVLPFYFLCLCLGKLKLTWAKSPWIDFLVLIFVLYVLSEFIRNPTGIGILGEEQERINGRAYMDMLLATIAFITISTIKTNSLTLRKILFYAIIASFAINMFSLIQGFLFPESVQADPSDPTSGMSEGEKMEGSRYSAFMGIGAFLFSYIIARYKVIDMLRRPIYLLGALVGIAGVALSGFRSSLSVCVLFFISTCILTRRYMDLIFVAIAGICFIPLTAIIGTSLPYGIQRVLSPIPGITVLQSAKLDAKGSKEWRTEMWKWALSDREKWIVNKTWGDGFGTRTKDINNVLLAQARKKDPGQEGFATTGSWHSGPVSGIHRLGYVGLVLYTILMCTGSFYTFILVRTFYQKKLGWVIIFCCAGELFFPLQYFFVFGDIARSVNTVVFLAFFKLLYSCAKKEGLLVHQNNGKYMPLIFRKQQETLQKIGTPKKRSVSPI